jgi:hypothetical protein
MTESVEVVKDWPQPSSVGEASINACRSPILISYITHDDKFAVIELSGCYYLIYGHPNDEVLHGHPLSKMGLDYYSVHRVNNSSLIAQLERRNAIHPRHDKANFRADLMHYIITFQDATLEFVAKSNHQFPMKVHIFDDAAGAKVAFGRDVV